MRMIDRKLEIGAATERRAPAGAFTRFRLTVTKFMRQWQSRSALVRLNELDDRQLLDMGLRRSDVREVITSSFFSDTGLHLTIAARERARRHLRSGNPD